MNNSYELRPPNQSISPTLSISSTQSSCTSSSIFSVASSDSSAPSSVGSSTYAAFEPPYHYQFGEQENRVWGNISHEQQHSHPSCSNAAAPPEPVGQQRQHPKRSCRLVGEGKAQCPAEGCSLPPVPTLMRQADRKFNFVENLVDSATLIVETIWPASTMGVGRDETVTTKGVLPLRIFIQETLRRSRTSYSTLQVALYYLVLIRPHVPMHARRNEPPVQHLPDRALQCGRRMFLCALILASKYLQDRNYSARAWSKISGLNVQEINVNEFIFLDAIDWRLHMSENIFNKWTEIVLRYTSPNHSPAGSPSSGANMRKAEWTRLIVRLTADLEEESSGCSSAPNVMPRRLEGPARSSSLGSVGIKPRPSEQPPQLQHLNALRNPGSVCHGRPPMPSKTSSLPSMALAVDIMTSQQSATLDTAFRRRGSQHEVPLSFRRSSLCITRSPESYSDSSSMPPSPASSTFQSSRSSSVSSVSSASSLRTLHTENLPSMRYSSQPVPLSQVSVAQKTHPSIGQRVSNENLRQRATIASANAADSFPPVQQLSRKRSRAEFDSCLPTGSPNYPLAQIVVAFNASGMTPQFQNNLHLGSPSIGSPYHSGSLHGTPVMALQRSGGRKRTRCGAEESSNIIRRVAMDDRDVLREVV